jgi:hypothetical protein
MNINWIEEENNRAIDLAKTGKTTNSNAMRFVSLKKKALPPRIVKSIYIQKTHAQALDKLAFSEKLDNGKSAPELIEEAIELLLKKYKTSI